MKEQIEEMAKDLDLLDTLQHNFKYTINYQRAQGLCSLGYRKVIRCKDCEYHHWEQEPCHGKTIHKCSVLDAEVFKDFYCYHGKPKMKGGE